MLRLQAITHDIGISQPVVLRLILERITHLDTLHTISTGDGIADELYLSLWQGRSLNKRTSLIQHESTKLRSAIQSLYHVHHLHMMHTLRKGGCQCNHRITLCIESYLKRFTAINLCHEISRHRTTHHLQGRTLEVCFNSSTRVIKANHIWILAKAYTSHVLNHRMRCLHHFSFDWECGRSFSISCEGNSAQHGYHQ